MKRKVSFFAVLAMCAIFASNANANVASAGYVDGKFTDPNQGFAGTAAYATSADTATTAGSATNDSAGNVISDTYAKKADLNKIPVGGETSTTYAAIWVE